MAKQRGMSRRQFLIGGSAAMAGAAMLGMAGIGLTGCSSTETAGGSGSTAPATNGTVDASKACTGQDTPNLATLDEAINQNQLTFEESESPRRPPFRRTP